MIFWIVILKITIIIWIVIRKITIRIWIVIRKISMNFWIRGFFVTKKRTLNGCALSWF